MDEPVSPRIEQLREAVATDRSGRVVPDFWAEMQAATTPLVEPAEPGYRLLTFLWRASSADVEGVELKGAPRWRSPLASWLQAKTFARDALSTRRMQHVPGTDVWYDTSRVRSDLRMTYTFEEVAADAGPTDAYESAEVDPFNPHVFPDETGDHEILPDDRDWLTYRVSFVALPDAPSSDHLVAAADLPRGRVEQTMLHSKILDNDRRVWIYTPPGEHADELPVLVMHDGWNWAASTPLAPILDHLIAQDAIPPLVAVMHESPDRDELVCKDDFVDFLTDELLPSVQERVAITADPSRTIIAGQSFGGLNAAFSALRRPDVFGNVLSQSGSFWAHSGSEFDLEYGWLITQFVEADRKPICFYLDVGLLESYMVPVNRHMRDVLRAKGYPVSYHEFHGDHTWICWRHSIETGLIALTRDW